MYNAFTTSYRNDTTSSRGLVGVILHADVTASGAPGAFTEVHRSAVTGDPVPQRRTTSSSSSWVTTSTPTPQTGMGSPSGTTFETVPSAVR